MFGKEKINLKGDWTNPQSVTLKADQSDLAASGANSLRLPIGGGRGHTRLIAVVFDKTPAEASWE